MAFQHDFLEYFTYFYLKYIQITEKRKQIKEITVQIFNLNKHSAKETHAVT